MDLTVYPWIPVLVGHQIVEVSLTDCFRSWHRYRAIQADNPVTTFALYRFLLAVVHAAYRGPRNPEHWQAIRNDQGRQVLDYLNQHGQCFDLQHPQCPFMQDRQLPEAQAVPLYSFLSCQPQNAPDLFCCSQYFSGGALSPSRIARLLVCLQTIDPASIYANNLGDRSALQTPRLLAPLNTVCKGNSLFESLLLNLVAYKPTPGDCPTWETADGYGGVPQTIEPTGYLNYLTYRWRRLRWVSNGLVITGGNRFPSSVSVLSWEPGIAYRKASLIGSPLARRQWRNTLSLVYSTELTQRPRALNWIIRLAQLGHLNAQPLLQIQFFNLAVQTKTQSVTTEYLAFPLTYFVEPGLERLLRAAVQTADRYEQIFYFFKGTPYHRMTEMMPSFKLKQTARSLSAIRTYWSRLEIPFYQLLHKLASDPESSLQQWDIFVQQTAKLLFIQSLADVQNYKLRVIGLRHLDYWFLEKLGGYHDELIFTENTSFPESSG